MNRDQIDITMPATLRPGIFERTLTSFCKKMFTDRDRYRLILNVDPIGESDCKPKHIIKIAKRFFPTVVAHVPKQPSFPTAFIWCWKQAFNDCVFHMNEDWVLTRPVDIDTVIDLLEANPHVANMRFPKMDIPANLVIFNCQYVVKKGYLQATRRNNQFGTNPSLLRGEFVYATRDRMIPTKNPEKQFRPSCPDVFEIVDQWDYAIYAKPKQKALIKDIGRAWMNDHGFTKGDDGAQFTVWKKN